MRMDHVRRCTGQASRFGPRTGAGRPPRPGLPAAPVGAPVSQGGRGASAEDGVAVVARGPEVLRLVASAVRGVDKMVSDGRQAFASGELVRARSVGEDLRADPVALRRAARPRPGRRARALRRGTFADREPAVRAWRGVTARRTWHRRGGSVRASEVFESDVLASPVPPARAVAPTGGEVSAAPRTERVEPAVTGGLWVLRGSSLGATSSRGTSRSSRPGTGSGRRSRSSGR